MASLNTFDGIYVPHIWWHHWTHLMASMYYIYVASLNTSTWHHWTHLIWHYVSSMFITEPLPSTVTIT